MRAMHGVVTYDTRARGFPFASGSCLQAPIGGSLRWHACGKNEQSRQVLCSVTLYHRHKLCADEREMPNLAAPLGPLPAVAPPLASIPSAYRSVHSLRLGPARLRRTTVRGRRPPNTPGANVRSPGLHPRPLSRHRGRPPWVSNSSINYVV